MPKQVIYTNEAPPPIGPYSQAIKSGNMIFVSGQIALKPGTDMLILENITKETEQVMQNLKAILSAAGAGFNDVVKSTIFLSDMSYFADMNNEYGKYFESGPPARETVAVKELPKSVNVEISMIAIV